MNNHELDSAEGLREALDFAKKYWVKNCSGIVAYKGSEVGKVDTNDHKNENEKWYYKVHSCKAEDLADDNSYEAFQMADFGKKCEISEKLLAKRLDALENTPDLFDKLQKQREQYQKFHPGRSLCKPLDGMRGAYIGLGLDLRKSPVKTFAIKLLPIGIVGAVSVVYMPVIAGAAVASSFAVCATPVGSMARRLLSKHPPALRKHDAIANGIESEFDKQFSDRTKDIIACDPPLILVGGHRCYLEPKNISINFILDKLLDISPAYSDPRTGSIWLQTTTASFPDILIEEMQHHANNLIGFDPEQWNKAVLADIKIRAGKKFVNRISRKTAHTLTVIRDDIGSETLVEITAYYDRERKAGRAHEEILSEIEAALPNMGKLFREYKADEEKFFKRIADEVEFDEGMDKIRAEGLKPTAEKFAAKLHKGYVADLEKPDDGQISAPSL